MKTLVADRPTAEAATHLIAAYGERAATEARARAGISRNLGNVIHFCRWRQVERLVDLLSTRQVNGTIH